MHTENLPLTHLERALAAFGIAFAILGLVVALEYLVEISRQVPLEQAALASVGDGGFDLSQMRRAESPSGAPIGVRVLKARGCAPCRKAGLLDGDIVTRVNGQNIAEPRALLEAVRQDALASTLRLRVLRRGRPAWLSVALHLSGET